MSRRLLVFLCASILPVAACIVAGCSKKGLEQGAPATILVFAAASLTEAMTDAARAYESTHPGVRVRLNFAGSQTLAAQIAEGAPADVFLSADRRWMDQALEGGLVEQPVLLLRNSLVVVTSSLAAPPITSPDLLARPGLRLVLAAPSVPAGRYAREALDKLGILEAAERNLVSQELDVKSVLAKVVLGEADAGLVYATDIRPAIADRVRVVALPASAQVQAEYFCAPVKRAPNPEGAAGIVEFLQSTQGAEIFRRYNFELP